MEDMHHGETMSTVKAFKYRMGNYQEAALEWGEDADFNESLTSWGYDRFPVLTFGDDLRCAIHVYKSSKETSAEVMNYFVDVNMSDYTEYIMVDAFPSLLMLLSQLVPIADAALRQVRYEDEEESRRLQERSKGVK